MATKTTSVVFKQHDPQSVADLSGVAAALILGVYSTISRKNYDFWSSPVIKESPSTIWGVNICCRFWILKIWHQKKFLITQVCVYHFYSWNEEALAKNGKSLRNWILTSYSYISNFEFISRIRKVMNLWSTGKNI